MVTPGAKRRHRTYTKYRNNRHTQTKVSLLRRVRNTMPVDTHHFKRKAILVGPDGVQVTSPYALTTGYLGMGMQFALTDLPNFAEFTTLFDQFRINKIVLKFIWAGTGLSGIEATNNVMFGPSFIYTPDRDDSVAPASSQAGANTIREYARSKEYYFGQQNKRVCTVVIKPSILASNYLTAVTTGYTIKYNQWVDMANAALPHYGLKGIFIDRQTVAGGAAPAAVLYFECEATYYISCKQAR